MSVREVVGMDVQEPHPVVAGDARKLGKQPRERGLAEVTSVGPQVLGDEDELADPAVEEPRGLFHHLRRPPGWRGRRG